MIWRLNVTVALACSAFLLAGCGRGPGKGEGAATATHAEVTLHVEGMTERQGLTGTAGRNELQEAVQKLPGVASVEADLKKDLLVVRYDAATVTPKRLLEVVDEHGFPGKVVLDGSGPGVHEGRFCKPLKEALPMRSLFRSLLDAVKPGAAAPDDSTPTNAADVILSVPGMNGPRGGPDRVRHALGTLPWVEQETIQTDVGQREVRFHLRDGGRFNEAEVTKALKGQGFPNVTVKFARGR